VSDQSVVLQQRWKPGWNRPTRPKNPEMKETVVARYLMSVFGPAEQTEFYGYPSREAMAESMAETGAFNERLKERGQLVFADGLASATTATVVDGQGDEPVRTPGPYLESTEYLAGFWVIEVPDLDAALRLAAEGSKACRGRVEVRAFAVM
jgi:hypothetical protein